MSSQGSKAFRSPVADHGTPQDGNPGQAKAAKRALTRPPRATSIAAVTSASAAQVLNATERGTTARASRVTTYSHVISASSVKPPSRLASVTAGNGGSEVCAVRSDRTAPITANPAAI